jgi:hypothetical protein
MNARSQNGWGGWGYKEDDMRMIFGVLSLLIVVAIVGLLAKKQLGSASAPAAATTTQGVTVPTGTPKQQVDAFKQSVESAVQQSPRQTSEDATK